MLKLLAGAKPPTDSEGFELLQLEALAEAAAHDAAAMPSVGDAKVRLLLPWSDAGQLGSALSAGEVCLVVKQAGQACCMRKS